MPSKKKEQQNAEFRTSVKKIPVAALQFGEGGCEFAQSEDEKETPVRLTARTGRPTDHWYWGRCVHDLAGMHKHKSRLPIDYVHNSDEVIGYLDKFEINTDALVCSGALVPFQADDRASEIVHKAKQKVPYESSVYFAGDGLEIEQLSENEEAEVNGYTLKGPATIFRKWPLRGVAICPYGIDARTPVKFAGDEQINVTILTKGKSMSDHFDKAMAMAAAEGDDDPNVQPVEQPNDNPEDKPADEPAERPATEPANKPAEQPTAQAARNADGQKFLNAFGDQGGVWFAQGKTFEEAQQLYLADIGEENKRLKAENEKLRGHVTALGGEAEPVSFEAAPADEAQAAQVRGLALKIGPKLARFAASMKLAGSNNTAK